MSPVKPSLIQNNPYNFGESVVNSKRLLAKKSQNGSQVSLRVEIRCVSGCIQVR